MSRLSLFSSPLLLGFEQFEQAIDRVSKTADGYPPYDVEQISENHLRITLALAGFSEDDLQVQIEDNQLVVRGKRQDDDRGRTFLHRGIAARQFQRSFVLAEGIEVTAASLDKGLLHIDLERPHVEPQVRSIKINGGGKKAKAKTIDHGGKGSE
jgi:HSP20 family molecular chaperone IbpA